MSVWFSSMCLCFYGDLRAERWGGRVRLQYNHKICKIFCKKRKGRTWCIRSVVFPVFAPYL